MCFAFSFSARFDSARLREEDAAKRYLEHTTDPDLDASSLLSPEPLLEDPDGVGGADTLAHCGDEIGASGPGAAFQFGQNCVVQFLRPHRGCLSWFRPRTRSSVVQQLRRKDGTRRSRRHGRRKSRFSDLVLFNRAKNRAIEKGPIQDCRRRRNARLPYRLPPRFSQRFGQDFVQI